MHQSLSVFCMTLWDRCIRWLKDKMQCRNACRETVCQIMSMSSSYLDLFGVVKLLVAKQWNPYWDPEARREKEWSRASMNLNNSKLDEPLYYQCTTKMYNMNFLMPFLPSPYASISFSIVQGLVKLIELVCMCMYVYCMCWLNSTLINNYYAFLKLNE